VTLATFHDCLRRTSSMAGDRPSDATQFRTVIFCIAALRRRAEIAYRRRLLDYVGLFLLLFHGGGGKLGYQYSYFLSTSPHELEVRPKAGYVHPMYSSSTTVANPANLHRLSRAS